MSMPAAIKAKSDRLNTTEDLICPLLHVNTVLDRYDDHSKHSKRA